MSIPSLIISLQKVLFGGSWGSTVTSATVIVSLPVYLVSTGLVEISLRNPTICVRQVARSTMTNSTKSLEKTVLVKVVIELKLRFI